MDVVGGFRLADGRSAKALTGVVDHSRFCVSAYLMAREISGNVCDELALALRTYGVPGQILTDIGKVCTGRVQSSAGGGVLRPGLSGERDRAPVDPVPLPDHDPEGGSVPPGDPYRVPYRPREFADLAHAQAELDEWVVEYHTRRPHQALDMATPAERFEQPVPAPVTVLRGVWTAGRPNPDRDDGFWVVRRASPVGVVCVNWQQVCLGVAAAGHTIDVWVNDQTMQFYNGNHLLETTNRLRRGEVKQRKVQVPGGRRKVKTSVRDQPK